jgi:hypothetical protein
VKGQGKTQIPRNALKNKKIDIYDRHEIYHTEIAVFGHLFFYSGAVFMYGIREESEVAFVAKIPVRAPLSLQGGSSGGPAPSGSTVVTQGD